MPRGTDFVMNAVAGVDTAINLLSSAYFVWQATDPAMNWLDTGSSDEILTDSRLYAGTALTLAVLFTTVSAGYAKRETFKFLHPSSNAGAEPLLGSPAQEERAVSVTNAQTAMLYGNIAARAMTASNVLSVATGLVTDKIAEVVLPSWFAPVSKSLFAIGGLFSGAIDSQLAARAMAVNNSREYNPRLTEHTAPGARNVSLNHDDDTGSSKKEGGWCPCPSLGRRSGE